jgi:hypothetical protein
MLGYPQIEHNKKVVEEIFQDYPVDIESLPSYDTFIDTSLCAIMSIKLWDYKLKEFGSIPSGPSKYLQETISNLNQIILLSTLGFTIPTYMLLRRSLENTFTFLYYKDHPIEYYHKDVNFKRSLSRDNLKKYLTDYPFEIKIERLNKDKIMALMKKIVLLEDDNYKSLSNYVHATSSEHLDLKYYIDDLKSDDDFLKSITPIIADISTIVNMMNILFFHKEYFDFKEEDKEIVRLAISNKLDLKADLKEIFGEF